MNKFYLFLNILILALASGYAAVNPPEGEVSPNFSDVGVEGTLAVDTISSNQAEDDFTRFENGVIVSGAVNSQSIGAAEAQFGQLNGDTTVKGQLNVDSIASDSSWDDKIRIQDDVIITNLRDLGVQGNISANSVEALGVTAALQMGGYYVVRDFVTKAELSAWPDGREDGQIRYSYYEHNSCGGSSATSCNIYPFLNAEIKGTVKTAQACSYFLKDDNLSDFDDDDTVALTYTTCFSPTGANHHEFVDVD